MQKNIYQLSVILVLLQSHAAEYQFVSASPHLAVQERMKVQCVAVVATGEPAHYGFQKSKGNTGQVTDGAGTRAHAVLQGGLSSGDGLAAAGRIVLSPFAAVVGAISEGTRKVAPDALAESEADLISAMAQMANQSLLRDRLVKVAREKAGRVMTIRDDMSVLTDRSEDYRTLPSSPLKKAPGEGTGPTMHADFRGNLVGHAPSRGEQDVFEQAASDGIDALLETTVQDIRLQRTGSRDSSYALFIDTRVRLLRPDDGAILYDHPFHYQSGTSLFVDWTLNHAEPFKVQVQSAYEKLAEKIVERVLLDPAYETARQLDSRTLARNKSQKRPGNPPLILAANTSQRYHNGPLIAANDWIGGL